MSHVEDPETVPALDAGGQRGLNAAAWSSIAAAGARMSRWPWWVQVAGLYIAARLVSACIFMAAALHQGVNPWFPAKPDYWNFINIWDARWYSEALQNGYPALLPTDAAGTVQENAWAFYPLFPVLGRVVSGLTGTGPAWSLTAIALAAGLGAALVAYRIFRHRASHRTALWGIIFLAAFPVAPVLQVPYAESLNLLLLGAALLLVMERRYLWAMPVVLLMCLSRPTGVPFAVMMGLLFLYRLWQRLTGRPPRGVPVHTNAQLWSLGGLTAVSGVGALLWPAIAWAATGDLGAYTKTETAWRGDDLVPFKPWFDTGIMLFGPTLGVLAPFLFVAAFTLFMMSRPVVALGAELRLWCCCYMGYLLAFLQPQTSTFRMLLPLFPLALSAALLSRSRAYRGAVVVMFVLLQIVWIVWLWAWAPLPGGGDYPP
ncbi:hypothetical protein C9424_13495 [Arthrobacter sp. H-02-3]|nr:hypothetical protein C9424_13495 [Arthrobacter sp. H-02-3]